VLGSFRPILQLARAASSRWPLLTPAENNWSPHMQSTTWELASRSIRLVDCSLAQAQCSNSTTLACVPNGYRSWESRTASKLRSFAAAVEWAAFLGGLFLL